VGHPILDNAQESEDKFKRKTQVREPSANLGHPASVVSKEFKRRIQKNSKDKLGGFGWRWS
jgi:hypothetical protein